LASISNPDPTALLVVKPCAKAPKEARLTLKKNNFLYSFIILLF